MSSPGSENRARGPVCRNALGQSPPSVPHYPHQLGSPPLTLLRIVFGGSLGLVGGTWETIEKAPLSVAGGVGNMFGSFLVPVAGVLSISEDNRFSSNLHWLQNSR